METLQEIITTLKALEKQRKEKQQNSVKSIKVYGVFDGEKYRVIGTELWRALNNAPCGFFTLGGFTFDVKTLKELVGIEKDVVYTLAIEKDVTFECTAGSRFSSPKTAKTDAMLVVTIEGNRGIFRLRDKEFQADSLALEISKNGADEQETAVAGLTFENGFMTTTTEVRAAIQGLKSRDEIKIGDYASLPVDKLRKFISKKSVIAVVYDDNDQAVLIGPDSKTAKNEELDPVYFWEVVETGSYPDRNVAILQNELVVDHIKTYVEGADGYDVEISGEIVTFSSQTITRTATIFEVMKPLPKRWVKTVQSYQVTAVNVPIEPEYLLLPANCAVANQPAENAPEQPEIKYLHGDAMARRFFATHPELSAKQAYKMAKTIVKNWQDGEVGRNGWKMAAGEREKFWNTAVAIIWEKIAGSTLPTEFFGKTAGIGLYVTRNIGTVKDGWNWQDIFATEFGNEIDKNQTYLIKPYCKQEIKNER